MELCKSKAIHIVDYHQIDPGQFARPFSMDNEELEERLNRLRSRHGIMEAAKRVEEDDFVVLDSRSPVARFQKSGLNLRVGKGLFSGELEQAILGMEVGEARTLRLTEAEVTVTVLSVCRRVLPPLTDETVASWNLEGVRTVPELVSSVREEARDQYVEDLAESLAVEISNAVNAGSTFELDREELEEVVAADMVMADDMLHAAGVDPGTSSEEEILAATGRSLEEYYEMMRALSVDGLKSTAVGAALMERDGISVTDREYQDAVRYTADGMGLSMEEAARVLTWPKFLRQAAANYHFEKIIEYAKSYLKQEVSS